MTELKRKLNAFFAKYEFEYRVLVVIAIAYLFYAHTHYSVYDKVRDVIYSNEHRNPDRIQCLPLFLYG